MSKSSKSTRTLAKIEKLQKKIFFFKSIFDNDATKITSAEPGNYDFAVFQELWNKREEEKARASSNKIGDLESKITSFQNKLNQNIIQNDQNMENQIKSLKQRLSEVEGINTKLSAEINELNDIIGKKNTEIQNLKSLENEVATMKAEMLMKELKSKSKHDINNLQTRINENEKFNEILRLKNELEFAHEKIYHFEKAVEAMNKVPSPTHSDPLPKGGSQGTSPINYQENHREIASSASNSRKNSITLASPPLGNHIEMSSEEKKDFEEAGKYIEIPLNGKDDIGGRLKRSNSNPSLREQLILNQEYLKNVMLKYFLYTARNNIKEASILEQAICTILKMTKQEKDMIESAKRGGSIWSSIFNKRR